MKNVRRLIRKVLVLTLAPYVVLSVVLGVFQDRFIYPGAYSPAPAWTIQSAFMQHFSYVPIHAAPGVDLMALYRPPAAGKPTIVLFQGNNSPPEDYALLYKAWITHGYGIVAPVYRGFPRSTGDISADGMMADALAVYDWTKKRHPLSPIVAFGQSLGTASAVHLAANRPVARVVLVSPFLSMAAIVKDMFFFLPAETLLRSPLHADLDIPSVTAPIMAFHGDRDGLIPLSQAEALLALTKAPKEFVVVEGAGHVDGLFGYRMVQRMNAFIGIVEDSN
jgi:fermentation-respiration switch protein FrsA (DUF1100 family)